MRDALDDMSAKWVSIPDWRLAELEACEAALAARSEPGAERLDVKLHPGQHEFRTVCRLCGEDGVLHVSTITHHERVRIDDPRLAETEPKP